MYFDYARDFEMRSSYYHQVQNVLNQRERFERETRRIIIGLESEIGLHLGPTSFNAIEDARANILRRLPEGTGDVELGLSQLEIRTDPIQLHSGLDWKNVLNIYEDIFKKVRVAAKEEGVAILRIGANPFLPAENTPRTNKKKYQSVPDFHNQFKSRLKKTRIGKNGCSVDVHDAAVVGNLQSFQINLEAQSLTDSVDKLNRSLMIAPFLSAISGNARYLDCTDTQFDDVRMIAWEKSHEVRVSTSEEARIGLPNRYFSNIEHYFNRCGSFPFILFNPENALSIAIGLNWLDTRIKLIGDSAVVEMRILSTQPTLEEEMDLCIFWVGRLAYSQMQREKLMPLSKVRFNRLQAMKNGMNKVMWFLEDNKFVLKDCRHGLRNEIQKAMEGLSYLGLREEVDMSAFLEKLLIPTPSIQLARILDQREKIKENEMMDALKNLGMFLA